MYQHRDPDCAFIHDFHGLRPFGIDVLTGESCAHGLRMLCDLTDEGKLIVIKALGLGSAGFEPAWNSKGTGSIMLHYGMLEILSIYAMLTAGYERIFVCGQGVAGASSGKAAEYYDMAIRDQRWAVEHYEKNKQELPRGYRWYGGVIRILTNCAADRNVHQMTGRSV